MNYLQQQVSKDDKVVEAVKISYLAMFSGIVWAIIFVYLGIKLNAMFLSGIGLIIAFLQFLDIQCTHLGFSTRKIIGRQGVVNSKTMDSPLNKIDNVSVSRTLFGMILGYSKVQINTSSGSYTFNYIRNAETFKKNLMDTVDRYEKELLNQQAQQLYAMNMQAQQNQMNPQQGYNNYNNPMN